MRRETKWELSLFQANDMDAIAGHFERMEAKGWRLESIDSWGYRYRRVEPGKVRYAAACFPDASVYDPAPTEGQETYIEYCRAAGWELAGVYGPMQFFRSALPDPVPVETDEAVKLTAVRRTMGKTLLPSCGVGILLAVMYLVMQTGSFRMDPLEYFSRDLYLSLLLLTAVCLGLMCRDMLGRRMGPTLAVYLAVYALLILTAGRVLKWIKRRSGSRGEVRGKYFVYAVGAGVLAAMVLTIFALALGGGRREPAEVYVKEYPGGETIEWNIYRDPLPVTLEELGYPVAEEDHCTYEAEVHRSFLASHGAYRQRAMAYGSQLPEMEYTVTVIGWDRLREMCWERFLEKKDDPELWPLRKLDPAPWGALEAYRQDDLAIYYLLYPERIVTLNLWDGVSSGQVGQILETLLEE